MSLTPEEKRRVFRDLKADFANERRAKRKASKKAGDVARKLNPMKGQREPRVVDRNYLIWIRSLPCIACAIRGPSGTVARCEAAHIRAGYSTAGWRPTGMQEKPGDRRTAPLCASHHREGPKAQHAENERAWWEALGVYPPEMCAALSHAYAMADDGATVVQRFAAAALSVQQALPRWSGGEADCETNLNTIAEQEGKADV